MSIPAPLSATAGRGEVNTYLAATIMLAPVFYWLAMIWSSIVYVRSCHRAQRHWQRHTEWMRTNHISAREG